MDPVRKDFYENLYWEQLRLFKERLFRLVDRTTILSSYLLSLLILWQIREHFQNTRVLVESPLFLVLLTAGSIAWTVLFLHLLFPNFLPSLIAKSVLRREDDMTNLCKTLAFGSTHQNIKSLLANPTLRKRKDRLGKTPLFYLCRTGESEMVFELIQQNTSLLNQRDKLGETPFIEAVRSGHSKLVEQILKTDFIPSYHNGFTPLMTASVLGNLKSVEDSYIKQQDGTAIDGTTALHTAARAGQYGHLDYLLGKTPVVKPDLYTDHPVNWAIANKRSIFYTFIKEKETLEYLDSENNSLMHKAVKYDWPDATQELKKLNDKMQAIKNAERDTPLDIANHEKKSQHANIIQGTVGNAANSQANPPQTATPSATATSPSASSHAQASQPVLDFDDLSVDLEREFEGYKAGSYYAELFTSDLKNFYEDIRTQIVVWTGSDLKYDLQAKGLAQVHHHFLGMFPMFNYKAKDQNDARAFFQGFENQNTYVDNSIIVITGAEIFFDPKEEITSSTDHKRILKELEDFTRHRKLYFILIGDFSHRGETLTEQDMGDLFGKALSRLVSVRQFDSSDEKIFVSRILKRYRPGSVRLNKPAFAYLCKHCHRNGSSEDLFFVLLKELPIRFHGRNIQEYSLENVKELLGQS